MTNPLPVPVPLLAPLAAASRQLQEDFPLFARGFSSLVFEKRSRVLLMELSVSDDVFEA